jgi:dihydroorotate dehydrogenase
MYKLIRPLFFQFDPEKIHHFVTAGLKRFNRFPGAAAVSRTFFTIENSAL